MQATTMSNIGCLVIRVTVNQKSDGISIAVDSNKPDFWIPDCDDTTGSQAVRFAGTGRAAGTSLAVTEETDGTSSGMLLSRFWSFSGPWHPSKTSSLASKR
mmetsp:Transcript_51290/g.122967  ORF Transcript_51290/g.122967 Transcript_51290/m.122967 type:complete len:101 (-) Transcript_51290:174-476(-)